MWRKLWQEVARSHPFGAPETQHIVTKEELADLPPAARRYLDLFGARPGQPKDWSFALGWKGRFRLAPTKPWMPVEAVQYDTRYPVARFFHMKARMSHILPLLARDTYVHGRGHMLAKLAGILTVADGRGPELDMGELVTWLNDVVLFAPSMLLCKEAQWSHIDRDMFAVSFNDSERSVYARVRIDKAGAPIDFDTIDRYVNDPDDPKHALVRTQWSTPIAAWQLVQGRPLPTRGCATWHLPSGDFTYAELNVIPESVAYGVLPPQGKAVAA